MKIKNVLLISLILFLCISVCSKISAQENKDEVTDPIYKGAVSSLEKQKIDNEGAFFYLHTDNLSWKFFFRLILNIVSVFILIRFIYYPHYRKSELFFTFFIFNFIIFMITFLLNKVDMGMGAAFGLFAVFSMLRYRTENISTKDMTYLFLAIAIGLITAVSKASAFELSILNGLMLLTTFFLEGSLFLKKEFSKTIQYENIEMIKPDQQEALITDLKNKTGLNIHRISLGKIDFLKDTAIVKLYYYEDKHLHKAPESSPFVNKVR